MLGLAAPVAAAQSYPPELIQRDDRNRERRLPDGRSQTEAMIKEDHKRNLEDLKKMRDLIADVEKDIEKTGGQVVSLDNLKRLEELEKTSKRVRDRMRRY
ncbi:MAG: hypothetical protein IH602_14560 [Bryobacteraceae bacterium]|nr:hypothetical protein [Bryobacteraceae bacterium]